MFLLNWRRFLQSFLRTGSDRRSSRGMQPRRTPRFRPWAETLEDRLAPAIITLPVPNGSVAFGASVAMSGNDVLVGAPDANNGRGAVDLFNTSGTLLETFTNPGNSIDYSFGVSVAVAGSELLVGDPGANGGAGAAYLFSTSGTRLHTFTGPTSGDNFGASVALAGNELLVGAPGTSSDAGAAYLFSASSYASLETFSDPANSANDGFGNSVALAGNDVLVGAAGTNGDQGAAYLFNTSGARLQTFTDPGNTDDIFGASVALSGNDVLVGRPSRNVQGAAYLFGSSGTLLQTFTDPDYVAYDDFGNSVALSGNELLVGADGIAVPEEGAAYLFSTSGTMLQRFTDPGNSSADGFGSSVTLSGNDVLVGAPGTNGSGAAYLDTGEISALFGNNQSTTVGATFGTALEAQILDPSGNPVEGATVTFTESNGPNGAGATFPDGNTETVVSNFDGQAIAPPLTGNDIAGSFTVTATCDGAFTAFDLTNVSGGPGSISPLGGTPQNTVEGSDFGTLLQALVTDANGNPVEGAAVTFTVPSSGASGTFDASATVLTNALGIATAPAFTANDDAGSFAVDATVAGAATPAIFDLTNTAITPTQMFVVSGNDQSAAVGSGYSNRLAVELTDAQGTPAVGVPVTFSAPAFGPSGSFGVAWGPVTPITTDVATLTQPGTVVAAAQWGNAGAVTVTGSYGTINFQQGSINGGGGPVADTTADGTNIGAFTGTTGNASFDTVLNGFAFDEPSSPYHTVTIDNLTPGQQYSVQIFSVDDRTSGNEASRVISYSDISGDQSASFTEGSNSYVIGTFVAQAATETIHVNLATGDLGNINALVVRSLGGSGATVLTNAAGLAIAPAFTANHTAGSFAVLATDPADGLSGSFQLTNLPGPAATITALGGATQNTIVGAAFGTLLQAQVTDSFGNPVPNVAVQFSVPGSGASGAFVADALVYTNADGIATAPSLLANHVRGTFTATANVAGVNNSADFTLANTAAPAGIAVIAGNKQQAAVTTAFRPLEVKVTGAGGVPISGITVEFAVQGQGAVGATFAGPSSVVTAANGIATAPTLTADTAAGSFTVEAWVAGQAAPAVFTLTNIPGPAVNISPVVGTLTATVGRAYAPLRALVTDAYGNPVSGVRVTFTAPTATHIATGTFGGRTTFAAMTGANGLASAALTANTVAGAFTVTAAVNGITTPASFGLTNVAGGPAKMLIVSGNNQSELPNAAFAELEVEVTDSFGNVLSGVQVAFTVQPATGNPAPANFSGESSAETSTNDSGLATISGLTAGTKKGKLTVVASVTGLSATADFSLDIT